MNVDPRFFNPVTWDRSALTARCGLPTSWAAASGALVVAGQQPAFGGGPLYTLIKATQAVAVARQLNAPGKPVAALFWCASDDHDVGEAEHADLIEHSGRIRRVRGDLGRTTAALRHRPAAGWDQLLQACREVHGPGAGESFLVAHAPTNDEPLGHWEARLLRGLLPDLAVIEAWQLRPLWRTALRQVRDHWPVEALAERRRQVLATGGVDSFGGPLASPPLFLDTPNERRSIASDLAASSPDDLSPGAALRPILQQAALPAAVFIAGPGELTYHAFLEPLYAAAGVHKPLLVPRVSLTLAPSWWRDGCAAWSLDPRELMPASLPPTGAPAATSGLRQALVDLAALPLPSADDQARCAGIARLRRDVERLERSLARAGRQRTGRPPFGSLVAWAFPRGVPQDRTLSVVPAIWAYGADLGKRLVAACTTMQPGDRGILAV